MSDFVEQKEVLLLRVRKESAVEKSFSGARPIANDALRNRAAQQDGLYSSGVSLVPCSGTKSGEVPAGGLSAIYQTLSRRAFGRIRVAGDTVLLLLRSGAVFCEAARG